MAIWTCALALSMALGQASQDEVYGVRHNIRIERHKRIYIPTLEPVAVDEEMLDSQGLRKLEGKHITIYTDLPPDEERDRLPQDFDQVFPQWCEYFELDPEQCEDWHMTGFLMTDREKFKRLGYIPDYVGPFRHGYSVKDMLWMVEQPNAYRTRQLLLHEGTHGFMLGQFGSCGPPWYMEGLAELISTYHIDEAGNITLNYMPKNREESPYWGRIPLLQHEMANGTRYDVDEVICKRGIIETQDYAWCWALAYFLDHHPQYRDRFHAMPDYVMHRDFDNIFRARFAKDWEQLREDFQIFVHDVEYDYDIERTVIDFTRGRREVGSEARFEVAADRGWQNSGIRLEADRPYLIEAVGRYQVDDDPQPWKCEPGGVTMRYYRGRPLGMLLAAVRPDTLGENRRSELTSPRPIGLRAEIKSGVAGTLFFRINDSSAELDDNRGRLLVRIRPVE